MTLSWRPAELFRLGCRLSVGRMGRLLPFALMVALAVGTGGWVTIESIASRVSERDEFFESGGQISILFRSGLTVSECEAFGTSMGGNAFTAGLSDDTPIQIASDPGRSIGRSSISPRFGSGLLNPATETASSTAWYMGSAAADRIGLDSGDHLVLNDAGASIEAGPFTVVDAERSILADQGFRALHVEASPDAVVDECWLRTSTSPSVRRSIGSTLLAAAGSEGEVADFLSDADRRYSEIETLSGTSPRFVWLGAAALIAASAWLYLVRVQAEIALLRSLGTSFSDAAVLMMIQLLLLIALGAAPALAALFAVHAASNDLPLEDLVVRSWWLYAARTVGVGFILSCAVAPFLLLDRRVAGILKSAGI